MNLETQISHLIIIFFHIAGIIIGLGAVTVIDTMGVLSRKSKYWTQITIKAHHVTKPLIWIGTILLLITWIVMLFKIDNLGFEILKSGLIIILLLNGSFLSFYISPETDKLKGKNILFPKNLQYKTIVSMIISFLSWWLFVLLTIIQLIEI